MGDIYEVHEEFLSGGRLIDQRLKALVNVLCLTCQFIAPKLHRVSRRT